MNSLRHRTACSAAIRMMWTRSSAPAHRAAPADPARPDAHSVAATLSNRGHTQCMPADVTSHSVRGCPGYLAVNGTVRLLTVPLLESRASRSHTMNHANVLWCTDETRDQFPCAWRPEDIGPMLRRRERLRAVGEKPEHKRFDDRKFYMELIFDADRFVSRLPASIEARIDRRHASSCRGRADCCLVRVGSHCSRVAGGLLHEG